MADNRIAVIGCGNLGLSITHGLIADEHVQPEQITVTRRHIEPILSLGDFGITVTSDNRAAVRESDIVLLAVKPYNVEAVLQEIAVDLQTGKHILVSLASGVTIAEMRLLIPPDVPLYRAMPNIATTIRESVTCIAVQKGTDETDKLVSGLFDHLGTSLYIDEPLMEASTILGACGIAYVMRFIRAMIQGGIQIGFDTRTASSIVYQTVKGAAELLIQNGEHPEKEIDKVTTPKGCTIVGLNEMEHQGFSSSLIRGIVTSFEMIEK